jgi:hypothetical protein
MQSLNEIPCKISSLQGKACNVEMETNVMLALLFYVAITGKSMQYLGKCNKSRECPAALIGKNGYISRKFHVNLSFYYNRELQGF